MKLWLTAAEIADLALPGLPGTKRGVTEWARREGWADRPTMSRPRTGAGGGLEYHLDLLPPVARQAYVGRLIPEAVPFSSAAAAEAEPAAAALRDDAAEARDARLAMLAAAERFRVEARIPRHHADHRFVKEVQAGRIDLPVWVLLAAPKLSERTLKRWRATASSGNTARLAIDRGAARRGGGVMDAAEDGALRVTALALITHQPHLSADHVRALLRAKFGDTVAMKRGGVIKRVPLPPVRTVQDALKRWRISERVALTAMTNPDGFKSRFRASGSATDCGITRPNQLWQIDASPMDALCTDGRHSVYVALDIFTRRVIVYVSKTPRAEAVGLMLRRAILAWGIPERIKTDNGSDFTAKHIARLLAHLGIERELSPVFTPEAKAHVERAIGTFQRDFGPLLPGFVGHSVSDRKVIEARRAFATRLGDMSDAKAFCVELHAPELQGYADRWAADRYANRPHSGLGGATPFAVAAAYPGQLRRLDDARSLDVLLAPVPGGNGLRTVGKQGVRIDGSFYLSAVLPGTDVLVRMDPNDLGRAWLFDVEGVTFLGEAVCPDLAGIDPARAVAETKRVQREIIDERTRAVRREARKIKPRDLVETILRQDAEAAGKLVVFPRPSDVHSTPHLTAASEVFAAPKAPVILPAADAALQAEIEADLAGSTAPANVQPLRRVDTPQIRFRRALDLRARLDRGETIETDDALWLGGYEAGHEFRSFRDLYADFGEAAL